MEKGNVRVIRSVPLLLLKTHVQSLASQLGIAPKGAALSPEQMDAMKKITTHIYKTANVIRQGTWCNPAAGHFKDALFYSNGKHLVITQSNGNMITILKNAMGNKHFNNAITIWQR